MAGGSAPDADRGRQSGAAAVRALMLDNIPGIVKGILDCRDRRRGGGQTALWLAGDDFFYDGHVQKEKIYHMAARRRNARGRMGGTHARDFRAVEKPGTKEAEKDNPPSSPTPPLKSSSNPPFARHHPSATHTNNPPPYRWTTQPGG